MRTHTTPHTPTHTHYFLKHNSNYPLPPEVRLVQVTMSSRKGAHIPNTSRKCAKVGLTHTNTYTHTHARTHAHTHTHTHTQPHTHTLKHTHIHIHTHTRSDPVGVL